MLSRTADHLFWMSRYTERAGDMPQAFAGMTHQLREALVTASPKPAPTLFTSCNALPPEGAVSPWGGPAVKNAKRANAFGV